MSVAAFDVGGTNIGYGVLTKQGDILYKAKMATDVSGGGRAVLRQIKDTINKLQRNHGINGIAVSTAGQIDKQKGFVIYATDSLPGYTGLHIKSELETAFDLPVMVDNDVNCAALGEYWKGAARSADDFLCMTIGTGIGGAIIQGGQVYHGAAYSAGEFGHMTLYPGGSACACGDYGCYECYASSRALKKRAQADIQDGISLPGLFERAKSGDGESEAVIDEWVDDVALGLKTLVHIFNPALIVIGGGVSEQGDYLLKKLQQRVFTRVMASFRDALDIKLAQNGNDANLQGAVYQLVSMTEGDER